MAKKIFRYILVTVTPLSLYLAKKNHAEQNTSFARSYGKNYILVIFFKKIFCVGIYVYAINIYIIK